MSESLDQILKSKHWLRCMSDIHPDIIEAVKEYLQQFKQDACKNCYVAETCQRFYHVDKSYDDCLDGSYANKANRTIDEIIKSLNSSNNTKNGENKNE